MSDNSTFKIAWIGKDTNFQNDLKFAIEKHFDSKTVEWVKYELFEDTLASALEALFISQEENPFNYIFFDFTTNLHHKMNILKMLRKYKRYDSTSIIAFVEEEDHFEFNLKWVLNTPIDFVSIIKKQVDEIVEDIIFLSDTDNYSPDHFTTLGFDQVIWTWIPAEYSVHKDGKDLLLSPNILNFDGISNFKEMLRGLQKDNADIDEKTKTWLNQPDDFMGITVICSGGNEHFFQLNEFKKYDDIFRAKIPFIDLKKIKEIHQLEAEGIAENQELQQDEDLRKRVIIFDHTMQFYNQCWGHEQALQSANLMNFPYFTKDFSIIHDIRPSLIIINSQKVGSKHSPPNDEIENLLTSLSEIDDYFPLVVIFNYDESNISTEYEKLMCIKDEPTEEMMNNFINLLIEKQLESDNIKSKEEINIKSKIDRDKNLIYLEVPVLLKELSENTIKVETPFGIAEKLILHDAQISSSQIVLKSSNSDQDSGDIYRGVFINENEEKKTKIRKFVNDLNFTPKTLEQMKELMEFYSLNDKVHQEKIEEWKKMLEEEDEDSIKRAQELFPETFSEFFGQKENPDQNT